MLDNIDYSKEDELRDYKLGKEFGFPECCIENFITLKKRGFNPFEYMVSIYGDENVGYVRCIECRKNNKGCPS